MDSEWVDETRARIERLDGYLDKGILDALLLESQLEVDTDKQKQSKSELEALLSSFEPMLWEVKRPIMKAPSSNELTGDLYLGTVYNGDIPAGEFSVPNELLLRHMAIYAQTGHAKTTVLYNLQYQLYESGIPFMAFDPKKDNRPLLHILKDMVVIPWDTFKWNPMRPPPGMPVKSWWANLSQICGFSFGWFVASSNYLHEHIDRLYNRYVETGTLPTFLDLYYSVSSTDERSRRKSEYHDSVENRLQTLVSVFGDNLSVRKGIPLEVLCELPCSIEIHGLRPAEANWLVEVILSWVYFYRLYQDHRGETLRHVVIVDECQRVFDKSKEFRQTAVEMGTPIIAIFPSQFRDFGTGLVFASQQPSQVMNTVHANTVIKMCGNLSSGVDVESISEAMGLDYETTNNIHNLKRAQWIVKMSDRYTEPFFVETWDFPVVKDVSDKEVLSRLESVLGEYNDQEESSEKSESKEYVYPQLSDDANNFLSHINKHPFKGLSSRYKELGLSGRRAIAAKDELLSKGLAKEVQVKLGSYRPVKFLALTDLAISMLKEDGEDVRLWRHTGHMGFNHQLYCVLIAYSYRNAGYAVSIEKKMTTDRRVDVLVELEGKRVAIEVETGNAVDIQNKMRVLNEVDELVIVIEDESNIHRIDQELPPNVSVYHTADYLNYLRANYSKKKLGNNSNNPNNGFSHTSSGNKAGKKEK